MPAERVNVEPPKPWEILGAFFGYFAVAKDVPHILRTIGFAKMVPIFLKDELLTWNNSSDFWLLLLFTLFTFVLVLWFLPRKAEFVLPRISEWERGEQAKVLQEFCQAIGITPVKFHDLRATFITNLLTQGESLARVMSIVGHAELRTTNGYLRRAGVDVKGGTDKLGYSIPIGVSAQVIQLGRK